MYGTPRPSRRTERWARGCEVQVTNTSAWFALAGALGGVALAGVMGLVTAGLSHKWGEQTRIATDREQEIRTIRDQRREACHNYLVATNSFYQAIDQLYLKSRHGEEVDPDEHVRAAITALQDTYVYLTISCGADVRKLARSYNMALYALWHMAPNSGEDAWSKQQPGTHDVRKRLREAMRAELGVQD